MSEADDIQEFMGLVGKGRSTTADPSALEDAIPHTFDPKTGLFVHDDCDNVFYNPKTNSVSVYGMAGDELHVAVMYLEELRAAMGLDKNGDPK